MASKYDAIVIGAGHNGLTAAAYLARAGRKVLVLERRHVVGGAAVSEEIFPGFTFSVCSYVVSLLRPEIIRELSLARHGLEILPLDGTFTPMPDGNYLWRVNDHARTFREIARHSRADAEVYDEYGRAMVEMGRFAKDILAMTPPDPFSGRLRDIAPLVGLAKRFRKLPDLDRHNQLQLLTMGAVDFLDQWFETDVLKATMSASGIIGKFLGVRSPGTAYVLLHHYMGDIDGAFRSWGLCKGGTGRVSEAIASSARQFGAEIQLNAPVKHILVKDGDATGVVLENGDYFHASAVLSSVDPRLTFMTMVGESHLPADFAEDIRRYKFRGSSGKVNLALDGLPEFTALRQSPGDAHLRGAISISPSVDYMERAYDDTKFGRYSRRPYIDIVIPSLTDPSVAPPGKHVMSCFVQSGTYNLRDGANWDDRREAFGDTVIDTIAEHAPGIRDRILHRQVLTPLDLERTFGLSEGNIFQGELTLEQLFFLRPAPGLGRIPDADRTAVHVRIGDASRRRHHGCARTKRRDEGDGRPRRVTDVVVIGGGLNGLVAAVVLARAKRSVLLLEAGPSVGGAAATSEFVPGFRGPAFSHALGPVSRDVIKALRLDRSRTVQFVTPEPSLTSIDGSGRTLVFHRDPVLTAASINQFSSPDAGRWREFLQSAHRVAGVLAMLDRRRPPDIDETSRSDAWFLIGVARAARKLGRRDLARLIRWAPMSVADLVSEWFDSQVLCAAIAAHAIAGNPAGPRSAGTGAMLLQRLAADPMPAGSGVTIKGGPGALAAAVADVARAAGAAIRTNARVTQILTENGAAAGVLLANGDTVQARTILAAVSPKLALTDLVAAPDLPPSFVQRMGHVRSRGVTAKINLALSAMPVFPALADDAATLGGRILIAPTLDYLERAFDATKYGEISQEPWLEISIPSVRDDSLAPAGAHIMSIYARFVPRDLRSMDETEARATAWSAVLQVLEAHAPGIAALIVGREVMTPQDLEQRLGVPGGHVFHGETTLDQFWAARPLLGWARYTTPIEGLFLGSAGVHPGGGLTGLPGLLAAKAMLKKK